MKKFVNEFKEFIMRGNVLDLAVGVIIGGAFQGIVNSLIDNIISPLIGCFAVDGLNGWTVTVWKAQLGLGAFIMGVVNFIIMAFVIFLIVKGFNKAAGLGKKKKEDKKEEPVKSNEEKLLEEIRDLLKKK